MATVDMTGRRAFPATVSHPFRTLDVNRLTERIPMNHLFNDRPMHEEMDRRSAEARAAIKRLTAVELADARSLGQGDDSALRGAAMHHLWTANASL